MLLNACGRLSAICFVAPYEALVLFPYNYNDKSIRRTAVQNNKNHRKNKNATANLVNLLCRIHLLLHVFIKQFVVTNCSKERSGSIVTKTLKN